MGNRAVKFIRLSFLGDCQVFRISFPTFRAWSLRKIMFFGGTLHEGSHCLVHAQKKTEPIISWCFQCIMAIYDREVVWTSRYVSNQWLNSPNKTGIQGNADRKPPRFKREVKKLRKMETKHPRTCPRCWLKPSGNQILVWSPRNGKGSEFVGGHLIFLISWDVKEGLDHNYVEFTWKMYCHPEEWL